MNLNFEKIYSLDTNIILDNAYNILKIGDGGSNLIILPETVLDEIDMKKSLSNEEIGYQARAFARLMQDATIINQSKHNDIHIVETKVEKTIIHILSKDTYKCEKDDVASSIKNDRKILEVTKDVLDHYKNLKFISLDVMARQRALSLGIEPEVLNFGEDADPDLDFHEVLELPDYRGNTKDIPQTPEHISSIEITNIDGKYYSYFGCNDKWCEVQDKNTNKIPMPPINSRQKIMSEIILAKNDITVVTGPAGCSLPGSTVEIKSIPSFVDEEKILMKLNINKKTLIKIRNLNFIDYFKENYHTFKYDINSIQYNLIKCVYKKGSIQTLKLDDNYNSKYLKLSYWLGFNDLGFSINKVRTLRKYSKYFEKLDIKNHKDFNPLNFQTTLMHIQSLLINTDIRIMEDIDSFSSRNIQVKYWSFRGYSTKESKIKAKESQIGRQCTTNTFWLNKGYNIEESIQKVKIMQTDNSKKRQSKYTNKEQRAFSNRCKEYYINKGYSNKESIIKVKKIQSTFSLKKCIEKHGNKGLKIFNERQIKWQKTLNNKPQEEIDRINRSKGTQANSETPQSGYYNYALFEQNKKLADSKGYLYYFSFIYDNKKYFKIGISKNIKSRLQKFSNLEGYDLLYVHTSTMLESFHKEQYLLNHNKDFRISIPNLSTKIFNKNIMEQI